MPESCLSSIRDFPASAFGEHREVLVAAKCGHTRISKRMPAKDRSAP
jgi:hypothetical protein